MSGIEFAIPATERDEINNVNVFFMQKDAQQRASVWNSVSVAWQRCYELKQGLLVDTESVESAQALIDKVLTTDPLDNQFASQQQLMREFLEQ